MTTGEEIRRRYNELVAGLESRLNTCDGEVIGVLHQSEWLRILLVASPDEHEGTATSITVELSLSRCTSESGEGRTSQERSSYSDANRLLKGMIRHLEYLLSLAQHGFSLNVIREDCLWAATLPTSESPSETVFQALVPPL